MMPKLTLEEVFVSCVNQVQEEAYAIAKEKGFHTSAEPNIGAFISNIHGEVSELWEAYREGKLRESCDKATEPPLTCAEE